MGRTRGDNVESAPEEVVLKYKRTGKDEDGPSVNLFRADFFGGPPEKSPWNIRLAEVFTDDYSRSGLPFGQLKDVSNYFFTYLRSLKVTCRKMDTTPSSGKGTSHEHDSKRNRIRTRKKSVRLLSPLLYNDTDIFDQITSGSKAN